MHIAVANDNAEALKFLLEVWPTKQLAVDLTNRNKKGETPYSIATDKKSEKCLKVLDLY